MNTPPDSLAQVEKELNALVEAKLPLKEARPAIVRLHNRRKALEQSVTPPQTAAVDKPLPPLKPLPVKLK